MARRRGIASLPVALVIVAALLVPSPAAADDLRERDARNDYWHDHRYDNDEPDQHHPDWGRPDLRHTVYGHDDVVRVRIRMRQIYRGGYWEVEARFRTNEGVRRTVRLFKPHPGDVIIRWSGRRKCSIDYRIDYPGDFFVLKLPRRCLSRPDRVAFKAVTRWWPTSDDVPYVDVAGSKGYRMRRWSEPVRRN